MFKILHTYARYIGRVTLPKYLYKLNHLRMCDFCGENLIHNTAQVLDYGWYKRWWQDDYSLGYLYAHKNRSDCDANKALWIMVRKNLWKEK